MEQQLPILKIASLTQEELEQLPLTNEAYMEHFRDDVLRSLQKLGFSEFRVPQRNGKRPISVPGQPDTLATRNGKKACICLGSIACNPMEITELSETQCKCCDNRLPAYDVYYAMLLVDKREMELLMVGPVPVKIDGQWETRNLEQSQFLPLSRREVMDRYSPLFGGGVLFKMDKALIPFVLEYGTLPHFAITNLFTDREQGESGFLALMCGQTPTHMMLVQRHENNGMVFRRPFFFDGNRPFSELELTCCLESPDDSGITELMDKTGHVLYAECLEAVLFPKQLACGRHYKWTLSLVADHCRLLRNELQISTGPLFEQAKKDYEQKHGEAPPPDFCLQLSTDFVRAFYQQPKDTYTSVCARIERIDETEVDKQTCALWTLRLIPGNNDVEMQVFVGQALSKELEAQPRVGDLIECSGFLYASPDEALATDVSWQDSGEVAVLQETRELEIESLRAYRSLSEYSLAQAVIASACARAGLTPVEVHSTYTRDEGTFIVQNAEGRKYMLFVDTQIGDTEPQFHFTQEQVEKLLSRKKGYYGDELQALHYIVRLTRREGEGDYYDLSTETPHESKLIPAAAMPKVAATHAPEGAPPLDEATACRITCNAICLQKWGPFARFAHEDFTYTSQINGTRTTGKMEFIRYMAERKRLWEEQQAWPGIGLDTGTIEYEGKRRPCYMITCYGHRVGAAIVTVRNGMIASMIALPKEANASFREDEACAAAPRIFHPLRGHLTTYANTQAPLARYAAQYLQECMTRKTGFRGVTGMQNDRYTTEGVEFKLSHNGARWVKLVRHHPSFCDLAFTYSGKLYAICAVETPLHPENGGDLRKTAELVSDREQLIRMAERYNLIPCFFPVQQDYSPRPSVTWNLWDMRTLEPVTPMKDAESENTPPSEWEVLHAALDETVQRIARSGGQVIACHDTPELLPHIWCYDPEGQLNWIIIRPHLNAEHADCGPSDAELLAQKMTPEATGYVIDAEPYADANYTTPAHTREDMLYVKTGAPLRLT